MPFTIPTAQKVVIAGRPVIEQLNAEVGTGVKPGRLVKKGTNATDVVIVAAATDKPSGWVGWTAEGAHPSVAPTTRDTAYAASSQFPVWYGPGVIGVGKLASGQNVTKDTPLIPAANGELQAASNIANTGTSGHVGATLAGSFPPGGQIVAIAKQNCDASGGAQDIIVESLI